jgi:hypothetical protein
MSFQLSDTKIKKRLLKEFELLFKHENDIFFNTRFGKTPNIIIITISLKTQYTVCFTMPPEFPFHKPIIKINDKHYYTYLLQDSKKLDIYHEYFIGKNNCLCCQTILCNWSPILKLKDLLEEIRQNIEYFERCEEILIAKKIKNTFLNDDIPIEKYL